MRTILIVLIFRFAMCYDEKGDLGYSLNIGNAIDVFANYGDLSQVTQVVSADYEEEEEEQDSIEVFREKNIRVFANATFTELSGDGMADLNVHLCDTFENLLNVYFQGFKIEGTEVPWKAFMGDWIDNEIMRTFGLKNDYQNDNCCYVLVKVTKMYSEVKLNDLSNVELKDYVKRAVDDLNVDDANEVRKFMKSYGTHYLDSYTTGDFIYQVFKFKASGYIQLRKYMRNRYKYPNRMDNLRYFFSSFFLKHVGDIRVASGNKTIEKWAREYLRDSQYLYSKPNLLRLNYSPNLAHTLNEMLENKALLSLVLKTSRPLFKERERSEKYGEIVENDLKLWEVNA